MRYDVITNSGAKGLRVGVARPADHGDCTAEGASARYDRFTIVEVVRENLGTGGKPQVDPMPAGAQVFAPSEDAPAARLVHRYLGKSVWHVEPIVDAKEQPWLMAGGNYAAWSDSRISDICGIYGALSIHDRKEF